MSALVTSALGRGDGGRVGEGGGAETQPRKAQDKFMRFCLIMNEKHSGVVAER